MTPPALPLSGAVIYAVHFWKSVMTNSGVDPRILFPSLNSRPNKSFTTIIYEALSHHDDQPIFLSEIYKFFEDAYPYFRTADPGWRNSVRHALSSSRLFLKIPSSKEGRKQCKWKLKEPQVIYHRKGHNSTPSNDVLDEFPELLTPNSPITRVKRQRKSPEKQYKFHGMVPNPDLSWSQKSIGVETERLYYVPPVRDPLSENIGLPPIEMPLDIHKEMDVLDLVGWISNSSPPGPGR